MVASGGIEQARKYLDKLKNLLGIDYDQFDDTALVKAAYYVAQFKFGGADIEKFSMDKTEQEQIRQQLHTMAQQALVKKPPDQHFPHLLGAALWGSAMTDGGITSNRFNRR